MHANPSSLKAIRACEMRRMIKGDEERPLFALLVAPADQSDQNTDADGDRQREQRPISGLIGNAIESVIAGFGPKPDSFVTQICGLINRDTLTAAETIAKVAQNRTKHVEDLVAGGRSAVSRAAAGPPAKYAQFLFDGAQVPGYRREPRIKLPRPVLKHRTAPWDAAVAK